MYHGVVKPGIILTYRYCKTYHIIYIETYRLISLRTDVSHIDVSRSHQRRRRQDTEGAERGPMDFHRWPVCPPRRPGAYYLIEDGEIIMTMLL